jgi:hypothetical protein
MTTLGFHYFPDESHYRAADLQAWLPELRALGAQWLTLVGSASRAVPEMFVRGLIQAGIEPIVHIPPTPIRPLDLPALLPLFEAYERWGVKYVVLYAEPNARAWWSPADWGKTALVERFLDLLVPVLRAQVEAGLQPVFPPLKAGGDYWDIGFLEAALDGLSRRGQSDLARRLTFAVNLWTFNRPLHWGAGGRARWPESKPYRTPPGSQDQRGFRVFEWYDEVVRARVGEARPLLCLAGGPRLGDQTDPSFPAVDEARHTSCIEEIVHACASGTLPPNLLNLNFWLLGASPASPFADQAWYRGDGTTLAAAQALKGFAALRASRHSAPRGQTAQAPQFSVAHLKETAGQAAPARDGKLIRHYLLLPTFEWGVSEWHWNAALEYVRAFRPACGFSAEEASQAQRVTILGNEQGVSREVEAALRQAGCNVERLPVARDA